MQIDTDTMIHIDKIRADFPILSRTVYDRPLVYLDNAATTQKPLCVLDAMRDEYLNVNANVHRGVHYLSQQATELHEAARERVRQFINARSTTEIVFTRGTTEAINLVASSFCEEMMSEGDEVIVSTMEHHSNIVPWQLQAARRGITIKVIPINDQGELLLDEYERLFSARTRLVSVTHVSNVLGTVNPVADIIRIAHSHGVPVLIDGAQSAPHLRIDVQALDCDFFAFSGHKMYGPTGVGVLYGKEAWLDRLPPYQGGSAWKTSPPMSKLSPATAWSNCAPSTACASSERPAAKTPWSVFWWATSIISTWALCSTGWASPFAPVTIAPSHSCVAWAYRAQYAPRLPSTTPKKKSTRWWKASNV